MVLQMVMVLQLTLVVIVITGYTSGSGVMGQSLIGTTDYFIVSHKTSKRRMMEFALLCYN